MLSETGAASKGGEVPAVLQNESHLPSTELREPLPDFDENIDLRDYLEVVFHFMHHFRYVCFLM